MGLNNSDAMRLLLDIETLALPDAREYLDFTEIKAPSNWKDEVKIAAYVEEKRQKLIDEAALDLDLCQIVSVAYMQEDWNEPEVLSADSSSEVQMLDAVWSALGQRVSITFAGLDFDLPFLVRRSMYLGTVAPALNLDRYRSPHIDLCQRLSFNGKFTYRSLDFFCKRFKLHVPDDPYQGKDIAALVAAGNWEAVRQHNAADVLKVQALAVRMGLMRSVEVAEVL